MDYMWSLMFLLLAFYLMLIERYNYSGIALSFAIGSRITSAVMVIPLLYLMLHKKRDIIAICSFLGTTAVASILVFSPVIYTYGFEFLRYTPRDITFNEVFYGIATQLLSIPAMVVLLIALATARVVPKNDLSFNLSLSVVFVYALLFMYHPSKPAYLIPAVPWGLIILNKSFSRIAVVLLCVLIILNGVVSVDIQNANEKIKFDHGSVLKNYEDRKTGIMQSKGYMESLSNALKKS